MEPRNRNTHEEPEAEDEEEEETRCSACHTRWVRMPFDVTVEVIKTIAAIVSIGSVLVSSATYFDASFTVMLVSGTVPPSIPVSNTGAYRHLPVQIGRLPSPFGSQLQSDESVVIPPDKAFSCASFHDGDVPVVYLQTKGVESTQHGLELGFNNRDGHRITMDQTRFLLTVSLLVFITSLLAAEIACWFLVYKRWFSSESRVQNAPLPHAAVAIVQESPLEETEPAVTGEVASSASFSGEEEGKHPLDQDQPLSEAQAVGVAGTGTSTADAHGLVGDDYDSDDDDSTDKDYANCCCYGFKKPDWWPRCQCRESGRCPCSQAFMKRAWIFLKEMYQRDRLRTTQLVCFLFPLMWSVALIPVLMYDLSKACVPRHVLIIGDGLTLFAYASVLMLYLLVFLAPSYLYLTFRIRIDRKQKREGTSKKTKEKRMGLRRVRRRIQCQMIGVSVWGTFLGVFFNIVFRVSQLAALQQMPDSSLTHLIFTWIFAAVSALAYLVSFTWRIRKHHHNARDLGLLPLLQHAHAPAGHELVPRSDCSTAIH